MIGSREFPRLTATNHRVTSAATPEYNCVAWAAGDSNHWWQPGTYWPVEGSAQDLGPDVLEQAFVALGFERCLDSRLRAGVEKVALYGMSPFYTHASPQLPDGKWTSKLGRDVDIEHDTPEDVAGGIYGDVVQYMMRITVSE
jgi:hypothetical protein